MLIALAVASLFVGKYPLSVERLLAGDDMQWRVFLTLRLSRTVVGVIGGFALGVAGFVYQTVFRNPLTSSVSPPEPVPVRPRASCFCPAAQPSRCLRLPVLCWRLFLRWRFPAWTEAGETAPLFWPVLPFTPWPKLH